MSSITRLPGDRRNVFRAIVGVILVLTVVAITVWLLQPRTTVRDGGPGMLAIFYGWPSLLQTQPATPLSLSEVADVLNYYDVVVLGRNLQLPQTHCECFGYGDSNRCSRDWNELSGNNQQESTTLPWTHHCDHDDAKAIITDLRGRSRKTHVFGYVSIGGEDTFRRFRSVFGGDIDSEPKPLSRQEIFDIIDDPDPNADDWVSMGVDGIFLDEAEFGFGTFRERQNAVIDFVHGRTSLDGAPLKVFINSFNPDDVFSDNVVGQIFYVAIPMKLTHDGAEVTIIHDSHPRYKQNTPVPHGYQVGDVIEIAGTGDPALDGIHVVTRSPDPISATFTLSATPALAINDIATGTVRMQSRMEMNPTGLRTRVRTGDIFLLEGFQIENGAYVDHLIARADKALRYKVLHEMQVAVITTEASTAFVYDQAKMDYAWWSTVLYGFDFLGWGEPGGFSHTMPMENLLPVRPRPTTGDLGTAYTSPVIHNSPVHRRTTNTTTIELDTDSHRGGLPSVAYWRFEEGSGSVARDTGPHGNDGQIKNAAYSMDVPPLPHAANNSSLNLGLKGDYVEVSAGVGSSLHLFDRGITVEGYMNPAQIPIPRDGAGQRIGYYLWADDDIYAIELRSDMPANPGETALLGSINCGIRASGTSDLSSNAFLANEEQGTISLLRPGEHVHIAMSFGSGVMRLYFDGALVDQATGPCGDQVGPVGSRGIIRIGSDETAVDFPTRDRNFRGIIDEVRISGRPLLPPEQLPAFDALYVRRDTRPALGSGVPVDLNEALNVASVAVSEGIGTIIYDVVGCGPLGISCQNGSESNQNDLGQIIELFHAHGLRVEALAGGLNGITIARDHNLQASPNHAFDGVRFDMVWRLGEDGPVLANHLDDYRDAVEAAAPLPLYASIGHDWNDVLLYNGNAQEAYKHIIDMVAGVDVETRTDLSQNITARTMDEVCYGNQLGRPVQITIETGNTRLLPPPDYGHTFLDEGSRLMHSELSALDYSSAPCDNSMTGYAFHFYRNSFGSAAW